MPLSVVDLYGKILPRTNCGDCGHPTCLAFASMVVSEKLPLANCPHVKPDVVQKYQDELDQQHAEGKWTKRDMAVDALEWARERAASMSIEDLPSRIGGRLVKVAGVTCLELPYFNSKILIRPDGITKDDEGELGQWEKVFIYNHMAQGGDAEPAGKWIGFQEIPNTVSKIKSMRSQVEVPLQQTFSGRADTLAKAAKAVGGIDETASVGSADLAIRLQPLPRIPVRLLFWDEDKDDGFDAKAKLIFDDTITEHLDIESIVFLSERIALLLCDT